MNIFGIGGAELVVVILIALVVAGPKRMTIWAYQAGKYVGKLRKQWEQVAEVLQKEMESAGVDVQIPKDLPTRQNITKAVTQALKPAMDEMERAAQEVQKTVDPVKKDLQSVTKDVNKPISLTPKTPALPPVEVNPVIPAETPAPQSSTNGNGSMGTWSNPGNSSNPPA